MASDLPARSGLLRRAHLQAGSLLVTVLNLFRPRLTLGVRIVALDPENQVFLVRHSYVPGFYLPGGGVELGETCRQAAMREAKEEGGLNFDAPLELFNVYRADRPGRRDHVALFIARGVQADPQRPATGGEILEAGFFPLEALPSDATRATLARIAEITGEAPPSDDW